MSVTITTIHQKCSVSPAVGQHVFSYRTYAYFDVHVENSVWCSTATGLQDMFKTLLITYLNNNTSTDILTTSMNTCLKIRLISPKSAKN